MNQKQKIIDTYRKKSIAKTFDSERKEFSFQRYKHKVEAEFLKKVIVSIDKEKIMILDVGCGTGRMIPEVFSSGRKIKYYGLDTSQNMLNELKMKAGRRIRTYFADATEIPFPDKSFDLVFSFHLLWHLKKENQKEILREMCRVTKPKGIVVFDILNRNFVWEKLKRRKLKGLYKISMEEVEEMFGEEILEIEKLNDAAIKNKFLYSIFNIINKLNKKLPSFLYHMIYVKARKNE